MINDYMVLKYVSHNCLIVHLENTLLLLNSTHTLTYYISEFGSQN